MSGSKYQKMKKLIFYFLNLIFLCLVQIDEVAAQNRGEVGIYKNKFIWTGTGKAFVPNYIMLDMLAADLNGINEKNLDNFIEEYLLGHGFNGLHIAVGGQWFHTGNFTVSENDTVPDLRTYEKLAMIINRVYKAGGTTHLWLWGDDQRSQTAKSTRDGIMGKQEQLVLDKIAEKLGPLKGWTMGYGFDLWEWVNESQLNQWHAYLWSKPGWNHLLGARGARSGRKELNQLSESLDYSGYEYHKPGYEELVAMINKRPYKPSFSEDRYRVRKPSPYPEKDYTDEETLRGLWLHTMAGGIAAIWGKLDGNRIYSNKTALKCFSVFWNDKARFSKDMVIDNSLTNGYCLRDSELAYVFYKENTDLLRYQFDGKPKKVVVVDTKKEYKELKLGLKKAGEYVYKAPYPSDWAIAVE